jgi:peptidoglycan/xylan/chitin deacetylase (PgdA/CDA1 family)
MAQRTILTFHGLGEPPAAATDAERQVWVAVPWFEAIVDALAPDGVGLAFDDGNSSDVEHALEILLRRGQTASFFVLTGRIGAEGYLDAEDIRRLHLAGMGIGSHGVDHRDWRTLSASELDRELTLSRGVLSEVVGSEISEAACPFGSYDRRVLRAVRAAGYRTVCNSDDGPARAGSWLIPRNTVHRGRPLRDWLELAAHGAGRRPGVKMTGKRLLKRMR